MLALCSVTLSCGAQTLKEAYSNYWRMGMSVNQWEVGGTGSAPSNLPISGFTGTDQLHTNRGALPHNCQPFQLGGG